MGLSMDGLSMIWRCAIPDYFFESKWMIDLLKCAYNPHKLHVIAHDNVMQLVGKGEAENNGCILHLRRMQWRFSWVLFAPALCT